MNEKRTTKSKDRKFVRAKITVITYLGSTQTLVQIKDCWYFEEPGNEDSPTLWGPQPVTIIYVKAGRGDIPDIYLTDKDVRTWTCEVHDARQKNSNKGLPWKTNWEIIQHNKKQADIKSRSLTQFES